MQCVSLVCKTGLNFGGRVVVVVDCVSPSFDEVPSINDLIQSSHSSRDNLVVSDDIYPIAKKAHSTQSRLHHSRRLSRTELY